MPTFDLGKVVGPVGPQGKQGVQGIQGIQGEQGIPGVDGVTPAIRVGTVTTLEPGQAATVVRREDSSDEEPIFDFGIPKGEQGETGAFAGSCVYRTFEPEDWTGKVLRLPRSVHGLRPTVSACIHTVRQRLGRTAQDYLPSTAAAGRTAIINAMKAALSANTATPGTYPNAADGHVQLTWAQVQQYILEGTMVSAAAAASNASSKGFDWQATETMGTEETATLEEVLTAAYIPVLNGSAANFNALCTAAVLQGLRLRRKSDGVGTVSRYDLEGQLYGDTWGAAESRVYWDLATGDLVLESGAAFAGDLMAMA